MSPPVDALLSRAKVGGKMHLARRVQADHHAALTIRALEARVRDALGHGTLLGTPNLLPEGNYRARRVLAGTKFGSSEYLPRDGRAVLVLTDTGILAWASRVEALPGDPPPRVLAFAPPVKTEEILAAWLTPFIRTVQEALEVHLAKMGERDASYRQTQSLAGRIAEVLGLQFR